MPYTGYVIPNASAASFAVQAKVFTQDTQILADGFRGNGVLNGCAVAQRAAGANLSVDVAAGNLIREGTTVVVAGGNAAVSAAHATLHRIDLVSANNLGALVVTTGTAATLPEPPVIPQVSNINNIVLAFVYVPAADTAINTNQIVDKRVLVNVPGSGSGAPTTADYLVRTTNAGLSAERVVTDTATVTWDWSTPGQAKANAPAAGGGDFSSNTTVSVDGEAVVFSGTLGKTGKRATGTGPARLASGVLGTGSTNLASEVTGDLPLANVVPASAATRLLGRGSAAGAGDFQEITLGANLTMTGTSLAASGGGTTPTGTGFTHITAGAQDAAAKLVDTADLNNDQVTYAKQQNVSAASRLLGRGAAAGAGDPEEITLGANLSMSGTTLNASGSGTTPTGTGFPHVTAGAQDAAAKLVDTADVNNAQITYAKIQNVSAASKLLGRGSAGGAGSPEELTLGTNLTMSGTTLNASGSGGSVTVRKNTGADVGTRPRLNLIEGSNVTLTVADDAGSNEVDITIAASGGGGDPAPNVMTADVTVNNSTTLVDATGLIVPIGASATEVWWFEARLLLNAASAASDWKAEWTVPAGASILWGPDVQGTTSFFFGATSTGNVPAGLNTAATVFTFGSATVPHAVIFKGWIFGGGTAGNVQMKFAQFAAVASNNTIKAGSHTRAIKVLA